MLVLVSFFKLNKTLQMMIGILVTIELWFLRLQLSGYNSVRLLSER